jgi:hypothetical protein
MKQSVRNWVLLNAICLSAAGACEMATQVGCSSAPRGGPDPGAAMAQDGASVGMELTLPNGEQVNSVNWTVTGPNGASTVVKTGMVSVGDSSTLQFNIAMPVGSTGSYVVLVSGTSTDGLAVCAGTETFSVPSTLTVHISIALLCAATDPDAGSALITASTYSCATVTAVSASPSEVLEGYPMGLTASAAGPNPSTLTYQWSAPSGSFDTPNSPTANYTCATAGGMVPVTVTVSDGTVPDGGSCPAASTTVQVTCDGPDM